MTSSSAHHCHNSQPIGRRHRPTHILSRMRSGPPKEHEKRPSSNKFVDYVSGDIGKSEITAAVMIREPGVVNAKQVQNGRVQVVNVDRLVGHLEAEIVSRAVDQTSFNASAGHPHCERERVVIAAVLKSCPAVATSFDHGSAAEFGTADHKRVVKQAA